MITNIDYILYEPIKKPKAIVVIMHGMQEHQGRYEEFANFLKTNGYLVCTYDHLGHGKKTDRYGFFDEQNGFDKLVENGNVLIEFLRNENQGVPVYLLGHSMGSIVARCYLNKYSYNIEKLGLIGTPYPNPMARTGQLVAKLLIKKRGEYAHSSFLDKLVFANANKQYPDLGWLANDKVVVDNYKKDVLCGKPFTVSAYHDLFGGLSEMVKTKGIKYFSYEIPIKFFVGTDDPIVGGTSGLEKSIRVLTRAGFNKVTAISYEEMRHEILNEKNREIVFNDILDFFNI